jgi:hypothetical protein
MKLRGAVRLCSPLEDKLYLVQMPRQLAGREQPHS